MTTEIDHKIGKLYVNYFDEKKDYFKEFTNAHTCQLLTESTKDDFAYRKGIYITPVTEEKDGLEFNLLRCSTNLVGPTENFREFDHSIISKVNDTAKKLYNEPAELNHVLAQIYYNQKLNGKDRYAKIARHSDKTKDMPKNGIMVFCTFYDLPEMKNGYRIEGPNVLYKNTTALTTLRFNLKPGVDRPDLPALVNVLLYPNSAFFMNLTINRLYTHEIVPPTLPAELIPTRLGYVVRCSKQKAKFIDGKTFVYSASGDLVLLEQPTKEQVFTLKELYKKENMVTDVIDYGFVTFSMNTGDYLKPTV